MGAPGLKAFLIAGEPSGDKLGAALMAGLHELAPGVSFAGIGGPGMAAQGLTSRFPMAELSVMGLAEVLPKYRHLKRRIRETAAAVLAQKPDVLITIDSPDFCLRVARIVREADPGIRTIHYVAPSVWAWRPGRAAKMARWIDHVLALLPFEPPYMQAAGMGCDFVGHPVVTEPRATAEQIRAFREEHGISGPVLLCLPGSRRGELRRLGPVFGETLAPLQRAHPGARIVLPTLPALREEVAQMLRDWPEPPLIVDQPEARLAAFGAADLALAASGTVSLELAHHRCPMVIAYDMAWLTRVIMARMLRVDTVTLVNLVSDTRAIPERLGRACRPEEIRPLLDALLREDGARAAQLEAMDLTMERLGAGGEPPGLRAARAVLAAL